MRYKLSESNANLTVRHLLPSSNVWNLAAIREHLPLYEETIRLIYPSSPKPSDKLVWYLKNQDFSQQK